MPDRLAKGVYVDHAVLLAWLSPRSALPAGSSLQQELLNALSNFDSSAWRRIRVDALEVPILEEKKRSPTRHPVDLEDYLEDIEERLRAARKQVATQCVLLFSSPRFSAQNTVILLATAGPFYQVSVASRELGEKLRAANALDSFDEAQGQEEEREQFTLLDMAQLQADIVTGSLASREQAEAKQEAEERNAKKKRDAAACEERARRREERSRDLAGLAKKLMDLVAAAGDPCDPDTGRDPYQQAQLEDYDNLTREINPRLAPRWQAMPGESVDIAHLRKRSDTNFDLVWSGIIRVGSDVAHRYKAIIGDYVASLARVERARRERM
ncbi:hypothetical protein MSAN_02362000 [Mycena sanguinolenta]|uniref:Uncharacterized protein n=1 Tax=Mycena sanguinolenta TaxID=230812 RepID=A0A8H7CGA4_9AGAR|nr:hypothetical protein MSAN_02362000 [Mycena sanguinolenta]